MFTLTSFLAIFIAYLFGSLSSAIILSKIMRLPDPRQHGSKNPGATNVLRLSGKKAAFFTLMGDVLKGVLPVLGAKWYGFGPLTLSLVTLAVFLGHLYPIFFHFKGGKGVATALGALTALAWPLGLSLALTWLITVIIFRYSSLAALIAALLAPAYALCLTNSIYTSMTLLMSAFLIFKHRQNIQNLLSGNEATIGHKRPSGKNSNL